MKHIQHSLLAVCCLFFLTACGLNLEGDSLLGDDFEVATLGCNAYISGDQGELEVPPDLAQPDSSGSLVVPQRKGRISVSDAALNSYVLPERLDMRVYRESSNIWLAVDTEPAALWQELNSFLEKSGFTVVDSDPTQGYIFTNWRDRRIPVSAAGNEFASLRTRLQVRVERDANAVTNIYFITQSAAKKDGEWQLMSADSDLEYRILMRFKSHLAAGREVANPRMPSIEDIQIEMEIMNLAGVPVLTVGQHYSKVWRRLGVALGRSGMAVRSTDRSRGIYVVDYSEPTDMVEEGNRGRLQLHLLAKGGGKTLVTVHPNRRNASPLPYEMMQRVLKRITMSYSV